MFYVEPTSLYHAYNRSAEIGRSRRLASSDYSELFTVSVPDFSRLDYESLARSSRDIKIGMQRVNQRSMTKVLS